MAVPVPTLPRRSSAVQRLTQTLPRHILKRLVPVSWRLALRQSLRRWRDRHLPLAPHRPLSAEARLSFSPQISLHQEIKPGAHVANKSHNLRLAIAQLEEVAIQPGEIFSYWHWVGEPSVARGYCEGRALIGNQLRTTVGGGLCQLSGAIYYLALRAGLTALERYPHSQDIYTPETRFTPLGSDATVVYGYKDLRFCNTLDVAICFRFELTETRLAVHICATQSIPEYQVEFRIPELDCDSSSSDSSSSDSSSSDSSSNQWVEVETVRWPIPLQHQSEQHQSEQHQSEQHESKQNQANILEAEMMALKQLHPDASQRPQSVALDRYSIPSRPIADSSISYPKPASL
jgi:vancomycin resistance protein VanW